MIPEAQAIKLARFMRTEYEKWNKVVKDVGIKPQ